MVLAPIRDRLNGVRQLIVSPDGKLIVYRAHHPKTEQEIADYKDLLKQNLIRPTYLEIWTMKADGSAKRQITDQVAEATKVPKAYLSKVLQGLVHAGIVRSQRGLHGGVTLVKTPEKLTILEVVNAVEPIVRIRECPLGLKAHGVRLCPLHNRMDNAMATVEEAFRNTTLAEILAEPTDSTPLCEPPRPRNSSKKVTV